MKTSLLSRIGAVLMDNVFLYCLGLGVLVKMGMVAEQAIVLVSILFVLYSIITPVVAQGYHAGKYMLGMKIVTDQYKNPSWVQMVKRELVKMLYTLPVIGIAFLLISQYMMASREDGKTLHDLVARTRVIRT